ncbi:MAG: rRNA pseudouridine synthase [Thermodesulfovibrionales bacterium]|nr:rRNA pseudouridine synthase [Thermodesulfovibrionales bacterium]
MVEKPPRESLCGDKDIKLMEMRLQKALSQFGISSRRQSERLIEEGRVTVNGSIAQIGTKVDISRDHIKVDGKLLIKPEIKAYYIFYKPTGVVSTLSDPQGRACIKDYLKTIPHRVFPIGRLDFNSEGLIILTNDGELTNALLHPSKKVYKTYHVKINDEPTIEVIDKLRKGVRLSDGMTKPAKVKILKKTEKNTWLVISIYEGRQRQIRRMLEAVGHTVLRLIRVKIGNISLGDLKKGEIRKLTQRELESLFKEIKNIKVKDYDTKEIQ